MLVLGNHVKDKADNYYRVVNTKWNSEIKVREYTLRCILPLTFNRWVIGHVTHKDLLEGIVTKVKIDEVRKKQAIYKVLYAEK